MLKSILLVFVVTGYVIAESSCHTADGLYEVSIISRSVGNKTPKVIAFYAYKSKVVIPGAGRRLVFDVTVLIPGAGRRLVFDVTVLIPGAGRRLVFDVTVVIPGAGRRLVFDVTVVIPGAGRRLVFDVTKTNEGNGYNRHTGVFTCPKTGIYVFTRVTRMCYFEHSNELMINNTIYGSTFLRAKDGDDGSVSGTVVAHVSKGDTVYVRNQLIYGGDGRILSNVLSRTSFSGRLLQ